MSETKTLWACPDGSGYTLQVLANAPGFSLLSLTQFCCSLLQFFRETFLQPACGRQGIKLYRGYFKELFYYNKYT